MREYVYFGAIMSGCLIGLYYVKESLRIKRELEMMKALTMFVKEAGKFWCLLNHKN